MSGKTRLALLLVSMLASVSAFAAPEAKTSVWTIDLSCHRTESQPYRELKIVVLAEGDYPKPGYKETYIYAKMTEQTEQGAVIRTYGLPQGQFRLRASDGGALEYKYSERRSGLHLDCYGYVYGGASGSN